MRKVGYIVLTFEFREDGDQWCGICRELGTASCGKTLDEARAALEELVPLHLNTLEETGERARFFKKHAIHMYKKAPTSRKAIPVAFNRIVERVAEPILRAVATA